MGRNYGRRGTERRAPNSVLRRRIFPKMVVRSASQNKMPTRHPSYAQQIFQSPKKVQKREINKPPVSRRYFPNLPQEGTIERSGQTTCLNARHCLSCSPCYQGRELQQSHCFCYLAAMSTQLNRPSSPDGNGERERAREELHSRFP